MCVCLETECVHVYMKVYVCVAEECVCRVNVSTWKVYEKVKVYVESECLCCVLKVNMCT